MEQQAVCPLDSGFLRIHVKVPVDAASLAVTLLQPLVALGKVVTIELHLISTLALAIDTAL
jgi:hypothetical protein